MKITQRIASVLGPALVFVTTSEAMNLDIWRGVHPTLVYLNGLLLLVGGLVTVTSHNIWRPWRALIVTLSGWMLILAGAYRMLFPNAPQLGPSPMTYAVIGALGALGIALIFVAVRRD